MAPSPRARKRGVPPTAPYARTGELTPPGVTRPASRNNASDRPSMGPILAATRVGGRGQEPRPNRGHRADLPAGVGSAPACGRAPGKPAGANAPLHVSGRAAVTMRSAFDAIERWLFAPGSARRLAAVRIGLCVTLAARLARGP